MKCPFLVRKKAVFDREGRHVSEELEIQECIKNECMVYDGATKLCSLLSANIKDGILIDDLKAGIKEIKDEMSHRGEVMAASLTTAAQTLQEAVLSRFEIIKKQNEVLILGFDRLSELINGASGNLASRMTETANNLIALRESLPGIFGEPSEKLNAAVAELGQLLGQTADRLTSSLEALRELESETLSGQAKFAEEFKNFAMENGQRLQTSEENLNRQLETLKTTFERLQASQQAGLEAVVAEISKTAAANQDYLRFLDKLEAVAGGIGGISETVRAELAGLKDDSRSRQQVLQEMFDQFNKSLGESVRQGNEGIRNVIVDVGTITEAIKTDLADFRSATTGKMDEVIKDLVDPLTRQEEKLQDLLRRISEIGEGVSKALGDMLRNEISGLRGDTAALADAFRNEITRSLESLQAVKEEISGLRSQAGSAMENIQGEIARNVESIVGIKLDIGGLRSDTANLAQNLKTGFDGSLDHIGTIRGEVVGLRGDAAAIMGDFKNEIARNIETIKTEITNLNSETRNALALILSGMSKSEDIFDQSRKQVSEMSSAMRELNHNYLESLGKIAGLAEGMRKGVDQVGASMNQSVLDLVGEMKKEIGALEQQYEKTFNDIAQLADKFQGLNEQLARMTGEVQQEFQSLFNRQTQLADNTREILDHVRTYFEKEEERYRQEQAQARLKEAVDHFDRATLYYYRGTPELALNEIDKALEINATAEFYNLKGLILGELGRHEEALKSYQQALQIEPNLAEIYNNLGLLHLKMKKIEDAVMAFQEALKRNVNYTLAHVHLGKSLLEMEKYDEALQAFQRALEIDPTNAEAREAIALYKEGKIAK